jgi:site-specific recombinase XerD
MNTLTLTSSQQFGPIVGMVVNSVDSEHSQRAYEKALTDFLSWYAQQGHPGLKKAVVQAYKRKLRGDGLAPATVNQRLCAIRKLATEASDNGMMKPHLAQGIQRVKGIKTAGVRVGNWLTVEQAQQLLGAPNVKTAKGLRDRAVLAVLLGAGLRRAECTRLTFDQIQLREARWVLVDLIGKGNRVRSVPLPSWAKVAIDTWAARARISQGLVFRSMRKGDRVNRDAAMTPGAIWSVVRTYAEAVGLGEIAPHDLRRTYAKLAHKGGAELEQISLSLGHASLQTTQKYLGLEQDLTDAPCDRLGLRLE